ncbi:hypothetical protein A2415_03445 [candidate division WWE3 bacterium RIFOXYC1_FULL_39_7]|uniref:Uncharacterized protein n=2 Tax=Katanobacteria TaxID=422282 RepID=A0A1F4X9Z6_UNCKA|nr:MAG: hypothetical protein A2415_03445 [candidate division WWE3 bacterium RIFOXYC1_FULL_39_7]OGC78361.1 MAG: hypothetical protein A2619_05030 [candidate division WWE3 bacterium RIFOXYD1_FULL_39_9]
MKNPKIIIIGLIVLLLIGLGAFFYMQKTASPSNSDKAMQEKPSNTADSEDSTISGNLYDLMGTGDNMTCTFSSEKDGTSMQGVVYVTGKNSRSDITATNTKGEVLENHAIIKDGWMYMWSSDREEGMKLSVKDKMENQDTAITENEEAAASVNGAALMDELNYDCSKWRVDNSKLDVPTNVTFVDLSEQLNDLQNKMQSACDMCNTQSDAEAIAQCKKALNCQ